MGNARLSFEDHYFNLHPTHKLLFQPKGLSENQTLFDVLDIKNDIIDEKDQNKIFQTIKKHYIKLAKTKHPDKDPTLGSEERFKLINNAYDTLSDHLPEYIEYLKGGIPEKKAPIREEEAHIAEKQRNLIKFFCFVLAMPIDDTYVSGEIFQNFVKECHCKLINILNIFYEKNDSSLLKTENLTLLNNAFTCLLNLTIPIGNRIPMWYQYQDMIDQNSRFLHCPTIILAALTIGAKYSFRNLSDAINKSKNKLLITTTIEKLFSIPEARAMLFPSNSSSFIALFTHCSALRECLIKYFINENNFLLVIKSFKDINEILNHTSMGCSQQYSEFFEPLRNFFLNYCLTNALAISNFIISYKDIKKIATIYPELIDDLRKIVEENLPVKNKRLFDTKKNGEFTKASQENREKILETLKQLKQTIHPLGDSGIILSSPLPLASVGNNPSTHFGGRKRKSTGVTLEKESKEKFQKNKH